MSESAQAVNWLSHTRARKLILGFSERMVEAPTARLPGIYQRLLALIAQALLEVQERPTEPRAIVQRPSTFPVMMTTRTAWKKSRHAS